MPFREREAAESWGSRRGLLARVTPEHTRVWGKHKQGESTATQRVTLEARRLALPDGHLAAEKAEGEDGWGELYTLPAALSPVWTLWVVVASAGF